MIKFYTAFTAKTCEILFLLYALFEKVIFFRPVITSAFSNVKFNFFSLKITKKGKIFNLLKFSLQNF